MAEQLLKKHLKQYPTDVPAIRMLAEVAARLRRYTDAENLLVRCLELAPGFAAARQNYAQVLHRQNKPAAALEQVDQLLAADPHSPSLRNLKATVLGTIGEYAAALELYAGVVAEYPDQPKIWMSYGHTLKTAGRIEDSIAAYRKCVELLPSLGEAWWSLANLKTYRFTPEELADDAGAAGAAGSDRRRPLSLPLHPWQGAGGQRRSTRTRFTITPRATGCGGRACPTTPRRSRAMSGRSRTLFSKEFFAARAGGGSPAPDPIFIVGLPRSGSTLVEQILASHSAVEGTMELPDLVGMVRVLTGRTQRNEVSKYPEVLAGMPADELRALGEQYLRQTRIHRKSGAPFFIDKLPNNWAHTGLIQLILPNARIIDARRHPLSCCFSGFKQHFARGQHFTYSLAEIGRYYRDYVELMAHFDEVLPGRVHRVIYEQMVADTETEVRRLLAYCGLPFEQSCLEFYRNERAVRTASSEQVRRPIYQDSLEQWRHYDAWLGAAQGCAGSGAGGLSCSARLPTQNRLGLVALAADRIRQLSGAGGSHDSEQAAETATGCVGPAIHGSEPAHRCHKAPRNLARRSARLMPLAPLLLAGYAHAQQSSGGLDEVIVTAQKRQESLQDVPISVQALGSAKLDQLQISNFDQYTQFLPSVSFINARPGFAQVYFRGVASAGDADANHSGSLPLVGTYLDEQPITTIQGALDVHLYDVARVEALAGPQGTLYGASSEAGTIKIVTNKPDPTDSRRPTACRAVR